jgi:hypothetical protein
VSSPQEFTDFIGLSEDEARQKALREGLVLRSYAPGEPITAEVRQGRVTVFIVDGRVVRAELARDALRRVSRDLQDPATRPVPLARWPPNRRRRNLGSVTRQPPEPSIGSLAGPLSTGLRQQIAFPDLGSELLHGTRLRRSDLSASVRAAIRVSPVCAVEWPSSDDAGCDTGDAEREEGQPCSCRSPRFSSTTRTACCR